MEKFHIDLIIQSNFFNKIKNLKIYFQIVFLKGFSESSRARRYQDGAGILIQSGEDLDPSMFE